MSNFALQQFTENCEKEILPEQRGVGGGCLVFIFRISYSGTKAPTVWFTFSETQTLGSLSRAVRRLSKYVYIPDSLSRAVPRLSQ